MSIQLCFFCVQDVESCDFECVYAVPFLPDSKAVFWCFQQPGVDSCTRAPRA